jgi:maleylpyruvate isomerase
MGAVPSVDDVLDQLAQATAGLTTGISGLTDAEAREPSLLPNWTRGHVLTHLARNAEGGTRLLGWALTGVPSYEYPSVEDRAAAIEAGADRPAAVLIADVRATAEALADAAAKLPPDSWQHLVTWTTGEQTPADLVVRSRLAEVLIHHVDLHLAFSPASWPAPFVDNMLTIATGALMSRSPAPLSARLDASDTGRSFQVGTAADVIGIRGTEADLLAWLLGRSDGAGLSGDYPGPLPSVPSIYRT